MSDDRKKGEIKMNACALKPVMPSKHFPKNFIDIFPIKTYNNTRDGKPSSGEFLPDSGKLYIQEIPCQTVGNFKIEGQSPIFP